MPRSYRIRLVANQDGTVSAENEHGARLVMGPSSADRFSPVEVFVAALGGCSGMDFVELMEKQRRPLAPVQIEVTAERTSGNGPNLAWLRVAYRVEVDGDDAAKVERARSMISDLHRLPHARSRVQRGTRRGGAMSLPCRKILDQSIL